MASGVRDNPLSNSSVEEGSAPTRDSKTSHHEDAGDKVKKPKKEKKEKKGKIDAKNPTVMLNPMMMAAGANDN
jgi:hypothetical protein